MVVMNKLFSLSILLVLSSCSMNNNMKNIDIIKSTYEGETSKENGENLKRYLAPNAIWREADGFPYAGTYFGYDDIAQNVFSKLESDWINYKFVPEDYVSEDDNVIAYGTYFGINKKTNKYFQARVAHLWKLKESKIISFEQFVDSRIVMDAME